MSVPVALLDITVVVMSCVEHELTRAALEDTLRQVEPGEVLVMSDRNLVPGTVYIQCDFRSPAEAFRYMWYVLPSYLRTPHMLHIQWDGWVLDSSLWNPAWLEYDYVGAPWPWHSRDRVGNGGFSLRSRDLMRFVSKSAHRFPYSHPEDEALCRTYRGQLEVMEGFVWAPEREAERFSIEHGDMRPTFGFHDCRNWPRVLDTEVFKHRLEIAGASARANPGWRDMISRLEPAA